MIATVPGAHTSAIHTFSHAQSCLVSGSAVRVSPVYSRHGDSVTDHYADQLGCARGLRAAFILEAAAAFCIYGVWHLLHVVH